VGIYALGAILKSYLTGADGQSYAPGRLMAFVAFIVSQVILCMAAWTMFKSQASAADWSTFLTGAGIFDGATAVTCTGLILGQAPTDAGGAFWKSGSTPSSAGDGTREAHP